MCAHVSEIAEHNFWPVQSVEEQLAAHPVNVIWGNTDPSDVSIDTVDNAEILASSHTMENQHLPVVVPILMSFFTR